MRHTIKIETVQTHTLVLSNHEAGVLMGILGGIGGNDDSRKVVNDIWTAFERSGVVPAAKLVTSPLYSPINIMDI
jgi:hypothetical protein